MDPKDLYQKPSFAPFLIDEKQKIGAFEISPEMYQPKKEIEKEKPGFVETAKGTVLDPGNFVYRKFKNVRNDLLTLGEMISEPKERFNFLASDYVNTVDPEYWPEVSTSATEGEMFRKIADIDNRKKNAETRDEGSTTGWLVGEIINGATNPFYYAAIGQGVKTIQFAQATKNIFTHSVPSFMLGVGADEADHYFNEHDRTAKEAITNTAIAGIFGGVLGGLGAGARTLKLNTYKKLVTDMAQGKDVKFWMGEKGSVRGFSIYDDSVGSASARHLELKGESLYGWGENGELKVAKPLLWATGKIAQNPVVRGLTSKSPAVRGFINDALEHNMDLGSIVKDFKAPPEAIQSAINRRQAATFNFQLELADGYYEYLGIDPEKNFLTKFVKGKFKDKEGLLSFDQYVKEFYIATVEGGIHDNPNISKRSKDFTDKYLVPVYDELVDLDLLPPNLTPKGAAQHVMRVYDREYITANKNKILNFLTKKFTETNDSIRIEREPIDRAELRMSQLKEDYKAVTNVETKATLKKEIEQLQKEVETLKSKIDNKIKEGKYTDDMIVGDAKKGELKLRSVLDSSEIESSARDTINTILGLTEEQMNQEIMGFLRTGTGSTNPLKRRTLMINDKDLITEGLLIPDIRKSFAAYNLRMSRLIEMEKYVRSQGYNPKSEGSKLEFLTNGIRQDYDKLEAALEKDYQSSAKDKAGKALEKVEKEYQQKRIDLEKDLKRDKETVSTVYKRLMGENGIKYGEMLKSINAAKKYLYSTELGSLFLLQLQDAVVPIYRQGFMRYFNHGIRPFMQNMMELDFASNKRLRDSAIDMRLGIDTLSAFYNMNFALDRPSFVPLNMFEKLADNAANAMGILNFSSIFGDAFKHIAATSSQSSIIKDLIAHKSGKLEPKWIRRLLGLRLDPNDKIVDAILQQAQKHGEWKNGGMLPNFHLWGTEENLTREAYKEISRAKEIFQSAIIKDVNSVMFTGSNIASYPVGGEPNGLLGSFLMYMGWGFNATMNYTIPLFQKFDVNRVSAATMMMMVGSIVDPLRKLSHGQEITEEDMDPAIMFKKGLLNSGVLGIYADAFNKINSIGDVFPGARVNRYRNTRDLITFGPLRLISDAAQIAGMFVNQEWNKKDWKRVIKNVPLANLIYTRKAVNDWIDSYNIPETRTKAATLKEWQ